MLYGIDVSSYQGASPNWGSSLIAAIKVDQGTSYVNPDWIPQLNSARSLGIRIVFYHYPNFSNSVVSEVLHFLSVVTPHLADNDVLALDWEWYDQPGVTPDEARAFKSAWFSTIRTHTKLRCILYSDVNNWTGVDTDSNCGDGLWLAEYNDQPGTVSVKHPVIGHQYTSTPVDQDAWFFASISAWDAWARGNQTPTPAPAPKPATFDPTNEPGFPVWAYRNPDEEAWTKLCKIQADVAAIRGKLGA